MIRNNGSRRFAVIASVVTLTSIGQCRAGDVKFFRESDQLTDDIAGAIGADAAQPSLPARSSATIVEHGNEEEMTVTGRRDGGWWHQHQRDNEALARSASKFGRNNPVVGAQSREALTFATTSAGIGLAGGASDLMPELQHGTWNAAFPLISIQVHF